MQAQTLPLLLCLVFRAQALNTVGVFNGEGPPVPIPNTEVKLTSAENTCLATDREDRSMPTQKESSERMALFAYLFYLITTGSVSIFSLLVQGREGTIHFLLLAQEKVTKRTALEGGRFRFLPPSRLPLIETMKEGLIPSFKSPLRCTDLLAFSRRTVFSAGAAAAAPDREIPLFRL